MAEAIVDAVKEAAIAQESFGKVTLLYQKDAAGMITIDRSAMQDMLIDMNRTYENNGILAGKVGADGKARFSKYLTAKGQFRGPHWTYVDNELYKKQLEELHKEGFDAVLHIHLHPNLHNSSYLLSQSYRMLGQKLNQTDKKALAEYYESGRQCGFTVSMMGIVMQGFAGDEHAMYMNAFDFEDDSRRVEGYALLGKPHMPSMRAAFSSALRKGIEKRLMILDNRLSVKWKGVAVRIPQNQMAHAFADAEGWYKGLPQKMQKSIWLGERKEGEERQIIVAARMRNREAIREMAEFTDLLHIKYSIKGSKRE